jgi:hypothetical protein
VQYSDVPLVGPNDDSLMRFVIWHYRYDRGRRERRNVSLAAYDNETEYLAELRRLGDELKRRKAAGDAEAVENISGVAKHPGYAAEQRLRRALGGPRGPTSTRAQTRPRASVAGVLRW